MPDPHTIHPPPVKRDREDKSPRASSPGQSKRKRISVACDECRTRKSRCDGMRPTCQSCAFHKVPCVYEAPKPKANVTKEFVDGLQERIKLLEAQLNSPRRVMPVTEQDRDHSAAATLSSLARVPTPTVPILSNLNPSEKDNEANVPSGLPGCPPEGNDNETYEWDEGGDEKELGTDAMGAASTRDYKPGFFGGSSTLSFMEGIKAAISNSANVSPSDTTTPVSAPQPRPRRSQSARIPVNDVDALVLPPRRTADHLVDLYFKYVHTLYPWLHEPSFRTQYERLWQTQKEEDDPLFYCILNLVLALGCQFSTLFESSIHSGDTFFNRAKTLLGFSIFDVGTLQVVQALLLMGSYLQSTNRPNRCWNVLGMGIRVAQGLGLHIERKTGDLVERETRRRAWWGCVLMDRILAMLFGRPLMIHDQDAYLVPLPTAQDDQYIMPTSILPSAQPSKMSFYIATLQLYKILGDILRGLYSPRDDYRTMKEGQWLLKVSSIMRFDKELKDWLAQVPSFLQWGSTDDVPDDILRQRNVLQIRMLNVRNLLYRPSLILLGRVDYSSETGLDLSTTLTCARFCVSSAKDTIQVLHSTASRLTGAFWYNIFYIYTAATVLLGARLCSREELKDISEDWNLALEYLKRISSKSISAGRCLKALEVMEAQLNASPRVALQTPKETDSKLNVLTLIQQPEAALAAPFDPLSAPDAATAGFSAAQPNVIDWDMQDVVWGNLPWDWNVLDDLQGLADGAWGWGQTTLTNDGQMNGDGSQQQNDKYGIAVL